MGMTDDDRGGLKQSGTGKSRERDDDETGGPGFVLAYTINDAAKASGLARSRLYQLMATGELQARKAGRRTIILGESLRNYLENLPAANLRTQKAAA